MEGAIGLDIGGTKIAAALVDNHGTVLARRHSPTPATAGSTAILDAAAELVDDLAAAALPVGIGSAGTIDPETGSVRYATSSLPDWAGVRLRDQMEVRTGRQVVVDNDVNAAALGEWWVGAGRDHSRVLLVAVGTGVGGGFVDGGHVYRGGRGLGMDVGHLLVTETDELCGCGRTGHLEAVSSGTAIGRAYAAATGRVATGRVVADRAATGDVAARRVLDRAATLLGRAVAGLVATVEPDLVVLTGGAASSLIDTAVRAYESERIAAYRQCSLVGGQLGGDAVMVGAARRVLEDR